MFSKMLLQRPWMKLNLVCIGYHVDEIFNPESYEAILFVILQKARGTGKIEMIKICFCNNYSWSK